MLLAETNLVEIKEVLATLLQQETKKLTLIEANEYYVYEFIDPPAVMEKKSQPQRALICILAALFGGMQLTETEGDSSSAQSNSQADDGSANLEQIFLIPYQSLVAQLQA